MEKANEAATLSQACFDLSSKLTLRQRIFETIRNTKGFGQFILDGMDLETFNSLSEGLPETLLSISHLEGLKLVEKVELTPVGINLDLMSSCGGRVVRL